VVLAQNAGDNTITVINATSHVVMLGASGNA
jgi:hypothetical protein